MRTIETYITSLLMHNDCVVVPGLGGFVGNYVEAQIDRLQGHIRPPSKKLTFNTKLKHNDGLIADAVAADLGVSFSEATQLVDNYVIELSKQIERVGSASIDQVGRLHRNSENTLVFSPFPSNLEVQSFALPELSCYPILRTERKQEITQAAIAKTKVPEAKPLFPAKKSSFKWQPLAAALATILIIGFVAIYVSMKSESGISAAAEAGTRAPIAKVEKPDLSLLQESEEYVPQYDITESEVNTADALNREGNSSSSFELDEVEEPSFGEDLDTDIQEETVSPTEVKSPSEDPEPIPEAKEPVFENQACVIALGAFGSAENAQNLKDRLAADGFTPWSKQLSSGLVRVGAAVDCDDSQSILQELRSSYSQGAFVIKQ